MISGPTPKMSNTQVQVVYPTPDRYWGFKDMYETKDARKANCQTRLISWSGVNAHTALCFDLNLAYSFYMTTEGEYLVKRGLSGEGLMRLKNVQILDKCIRFEGEVIL